VRVFPPTRFSSIPEMASRIAYSIWPQPIARWASSRSS
jgi:hypothetical protein